MVRSKLLGISCDFHDAAAALLIDGEVAAAAEEERFTRQKHDPSLPSRATASCLASAGIEAGEIDAVVYHEKPFLTAMRYLASRQRIGPRSVPSFVRDFPSVISRNLFIRHRIGDLFLRLGQPKPPPVYFAEHHLSHASAAYYASPFDRAAILTLDGLGEWATASYGFGHGRRIDLLGELRFPNSLGLLYSLATVWCGFEANDGEYKLMGLAPFGRPRFRSELEGLVRPLDDGSVAVQGRQLRWWSGDPRRNRRLRRLFDGPARRPGDPVTQRDADLARSVQELTEEVVLRAAAHVADVTGESDLVLAGGVALNCVANARLRDEGPFERLWVQPAAGDSGSALGAALWYWHDVQRQPRRRGGDILADGMAGTALGPAFDPAEVERWLQSAQGSPDLEGVSVRRIQDLDSRCELVASRLAQGAVVGWFEGSMEFGPRALGHRSILADPRGEAVQRDLNLRVKGRESFRPFAPAVLWERATDWFDIDRPSPYMTVTCQVASHRLRPVEHEPDGFADRIAIPRSEIPACTHIDGSARVQTVHREHHPAFHRLLEAFERLTGCPVLVNTSFNRAGEPIVCTPDDALRTARAAALDLLVVDDHIMELDVGARVPA
jgi:carbamoyltransferase